MALPRPFIPRFFATIWIKGTSKPVTLIRHPSSRIFDLIGIQVDILICFKFIDQFIYMLYVDFTCVIFIKYFENLLVFLAVQIKLILLSIIIIKYLSSILLNLRQIIFFQFCWFETLMLR